MNKVYLSLGSNIGDKLNNIHQAEALIIVAIGNVISKSMYYHSDPWGNENQDEFINSALKVETDDSPLELLVKIEEIEKTLGRTRVSHWGPRTIDIDILFYNSWLVKRSNLEIPHPRIEERNFVIRPLLDIDKNIIHPKLNKTIEELYIHSPDKCELRKVQQTL